MKNETLLVTLAILILGFGATAFGYEGGTKVAATMTHPERGAVEAGPILLTPHDAMTPTKSFQELLRRVPEPTLSVERIRTEIPGQTSGTKAVVLFQRERRD